MHLRACLSSPVRGDLSIVFGIYRSLLRSYESFA